MMVLSSTDTPAIRKAAREYPQHFGWYIGPRVFYSRRSMREIPVKWAADNDCFNQFDRDAFIEMLWRNRDIRQRCLFVVAPDVVGDALATLRRFWPWAVFIRALGYPVALAAQDGLEALPIPWFAFHALFIGGTTEWKLSQHAVQLMAQAKQRSKWVHVGRVNSQKRFRFCHHAGADSVDGTTFAIAPDLSLRWALPLLRSLAAQLSMF